MKGEDYDGEEGTILVWMASIWDEVFGDGTSDPPSDSGKQKWRKVEDRELAATQLFLTPSEELELLRNENEALHAKIFELEDQIRSLLAEIEEGGKRAASPLYEKLRKAYEND